VQESGVTVGFTGGIDMIGDGIAVGQVHLPFEAVHVATDEHASISD
jgi:hypothetical protein